MNETSAECGERRQDVSNVTAMGRRRSRKTRAAYGVRALQTRGGWRGSKPRFAPPGGASYWSGSQASSSLNFVCGRFINSWVRYSCGSIWCRRQVLVRLARIAAVRPPRGLPTNKEFFRAAPHDCHFARHLHCYRWGPRHPSRKRSAPSSDSRRSSPHRRWERAAISCSFQTSNFCRSSANSRSTDCF